MPRLNLFVICLLWLAASMVGCGPTRQERRSEIEDEVENDLALQAYDGLSETQRIQFVDRVRPQVTAFCGNCHPVPDPAARERDGWEQEVNLGFTMYGQSGRSDLAVPDYEDTLKYFRYQAPIELPVSYTNPPWVSCEITFDQQRVRLPGPRPPGITHVRWIPAFAEQTPAFLYCDIGTGGIKAHAPLDPSSLNRQIGTVFQPVRLTPCDLDQDDADDLLVCDIGQFDAGDSNVGRLVWFRRNPGSDEFTKVELRTGMNRTCDARPGDFDGDGDLDMIVAEFGWRKVGQISLMENVGSRKGEQGFDVPEFKISTIDSRHGTTSLEPIDFDNDGDLDFVAAISQQHESVEVFINDGNGTFHSRVLWAAPHPAYGSCAIDLADLDSDGDLDVILVNGDSFDRGPKPYHQIQWLENQGTLPMLHHHLCYAPGAMTAKAADFNGDGKLDIVAAALLAGENSKKLSAAHSPAIIMMIQQADGSFKNSKLKDHDHFHASLETGDFNHDGKMDFVVGNLLRKPDGDHADLEIWYAQ